MKVREDPSAASDLVQTARRIQEERNGRLDGLHVSDLVTCTQAAWNRVNGVESVAETESTSLILLMGHALHTLLEHGEEEHRMEVRFDGHTVHGTADLIDNDLRGDIPEDMIDALLTGRFDLTRDTQNWAYNFPAELKSTRISAKQTLSIYSPHYFEQLATYCLMYHSRFARLYVLHMMGSYGANIQPWLRCWDIEYAEDELADWAGELERRTKLIVAPEPPSMTEHYEADRDFCRYYVGNGGTCPCAPGERTLMFRQTDRPKLKLRRAS